ncbi:MAG TPA: hypothetical protein VF609_13915 [Flavisolibacter sp.]
MKVKESQAATSNSEGERYFLLLLFGGFFVNGSTNDEISARKNPGPRSNKKVDNERLPVPLFRPINRRLIKVMMQMKGIALNVFLTLAFSQEANRIPSDDNGTNNSGRTTSSTSVEIISVLVSDSEKASGIKRKALMP